MSARLSAVILLVVFSASLPPAAGAARSGAGAPLATARALARAMKGGRSAEAAVSYQLADPMGGPARAMRGRVKVESPDRVRLDFAAGGERIALRGDGGEWLQPAAKQLLRISSERAGSALLWWRVLLPESGESFREDTLRAGVFRLAPRDSAASPVRIKVRLDAAGLPVELAVDGMSDQPVVYRLSGWKFSPGRGAAAYRLSAPAGFTIVDLP